MTVRGDILIQKHGTHTLLLNFYNGFRYDYILHNQKLVNLFILETVEKMRKFTLKAPIKNSTECGV